MGYVGLCTAVCFAKRGFRVYGVEVDEEKRKKISKGISPIHEPGLDALIKTTLKSGKLSCDSDYSDAVSQSDVTFVTVGTPSRDSGEIDLRFIESAAAEIGHVLRAKRDYHIVAMKSTVVPGTTEGTVKRIVETSSYRKIPSEIGLCVNPEFLREGTAIEDTMSPDAVVIGSSDKKTLKVMSSLYRMFYGRRLPQMITLSTSSAEFVKYSVNTFRATQLSFLNTLANLCEKVPSADIDQVVMGLSTVTGLDRRYLRSGLGFGGSCLPKDVRALKALCKTSGVNPSILEAALDINEKQPLKVLDLSRALLGDITGKKIALLGLAFKAGTDDIRESVAIKIANALSLAGAEVRAYDPKAMPNSKRELHPKVSLLTDVATCLAGSDLCVIATEWEEFRRISPSLVVKHMKSPVMIDGKRLLDAAKFATFGIDVIELGRYLDEKIPSFEGKAELSQEILSVYQSRSGGMQVPK